MILYVVLVLGLIVVMIYSIILATSHANASDVLLLTFEQIYNGRKYKFHKNHLTLIFADFVFLFRVVFCPLNFIIFWTSLKFYQLKTWKQWLTISRQFLKVVYQSKTELTIGFFYFYNNYTGTTVYLWT